MPRNPFEDPEFYRSLIESLPMGICILDREAQVRFWNIAAQQLTGHPAHGAVGRGGLESILDPRDSEGHPLIGCLGLSSPTSLATFAHDCTAYLLHREGHRLEARVRSLPVLAPNDSTLGTIILLEPEFVSDQSSGSQMYGCLDTATGIPSQQLTRALMSECIASMERSSRGFGLLRVRVLGLDEFRSTHGIQSAFPLLRAAARTLRHCLDPEIFVGRWGEDEFLVVLPSANRAITAKLAEKLWNLISKSEVRWWGDRFEVQSVVMHTVAQPGDSLEKLLNGLEPEHAVVAGRAVGATASGG